MNDNSNQPRQDFVIEKATTQDVPAIQSMVDAAYTKYIVRMGKKPAPMIADYNELLQAEDIYVLRVNSDALGSIVLSSDKDSLKINNLVVSPAAQGRGYGRILMDYAENLARDKGVPAMTLYTNVMMYENITIYAKMGFVETERRTEDGFDRVYFRKELV